MAESTTNATEDRALALLGNGVPPELVAAAVGVTASRISQLVSDPEFSKKIAEARYLNLSKHNERDNKYDRVETELIDKLETMLPMMYKPVDVLRAIQVVNMAKRRGASAPETLIAQKEVVSLSMPTVLLNQFTQQNIQVNINNQVIKAGEQDLVTVQSVRMNDLLQAKEKRDEDERAKALPPVVYETGSNRTYKFDPNGLPVENQSSRNQQTSGS